ncbi:MAG: hypothetical protein WBQ64_06830 [Terriglobales bacterium]
MAGQKRELNDIVDGVLYLVHAGHVSGEIPYVDGSAPAHYW